jgi:hypothetical protein
MTMLPPTLTGKVERTIVNLSFLLLFPGFFFYHTLLGMGTIGAFLGGYFSPIAALVTLPVLLVYAYQLKRDPRRLALIDRFLFVFLSYFLLTVSVNAVAGANQLIVIKHVEEIVYWAIIFIIFKTIDFTHPDFRRPALISLLAMSAIIIILEQDGIFYLGALGLSHNEESLATYQGFSRSYLFTFIVVVAFTASAWLRLALYCLAAVALFLNTARSEFVALIFVIPIVEIYFSRQKLAFILGIALLAIVVAMYFDEIVAALPDNRILELLDLSQSTSANKRHHLTEYALHTLSISPIFGDYASYPPGLYAHNVLSAWVDLGLFGMIFLLALVILPTIFMAVQDFFPARPSGYFVLPFSISCMAILLLLTAHYFTDMLIPAALGAFSKLCYEKKFSKYSRREPSRIALQNSPPHHAKSDSCWRGATPAADRRQPQAQRRNHVPAAKGHHGDGHMRYVRYDLFFGAQPGLRNFKNRFGFERYRMGYPNQ